MSAPRSDGVAPIDAYLDGLMSPEERAAFEASMRADPALAAEVALQSRIDASIRAQLGPAPEAGAVGLRGTIPWHRRRLVWMSAAAAVLLGASVYVNLSNRAPAMRRVGADRLYAQLIAGGYTPQWRCETDEQFVGEVRSRLGAGVLVPMGTPGVEIVGWAYADMALGTPISEHTMVLLTRVENDEVVLLLDRERDDRKVAVPADSGLHVFRREVGGLVVYEVSPLESERVLNAVLPIPDPVRK